MPSTMIVLASSSPRRQELLRAAGILFEAVPAEIDESVRPGESLEQHALRLAIEKAERVAAARPGEARPVVSADTIVVIDGAVLGKPESPQQAAEMLRRLAGRTHAVLTGLCVIDPPSGRRLAGVVSTGVRFAPLSEEEIREYVDSGEPMDKAGAYAIQGLASRFVEGIEGCYFNVVGLPIPTLYRMLRQLACQRIRSRT
jgi:septum formation protein